MSTAAPQGYLMSPELLAAVRDLIRQSVVSMLGGAGGPVPPELCMMPCKLTVTAGLPPSAAGSATVAASFTYTVKTLDDQIIAEAVPLISQRPVWKTKPATRGGFVPNLAGSVDLWWCDETPDLMVCA